MTVQPRLSAEPTLAAKHAVRISRFGGVGFVAALIDGAGFVVFSSFGAPLIAANALGFLVANIFSYVANGRLTFRQAGAPPRLSPLGYGKFLSAHLVGLAASTLVLIAFAPSLGAWGAKGVAIIVAFALNYFFTARFVFADGPITTKAPNL
ncbi:MAG: GtrA family protein [Pseudomonadota bacterium]